MAYTRTKVDREAQIPRRVANTAIAAAARPCWIARMPTIEHVTATLGRALGLPPRELLTPAALAAALGLSLIPGTGERACLFGTEVHYDDTASRELQQYQIARSACAYALRQLGLTRELSPHELALALCDVRSVPQLAAVRELRSVRQRRQSGFLQGA